MGRGKIKTSTGVLRLFLSSRGTSETEFIDKADKPLQEDLNQVFYRMNRLALRHQAAARERAERDRRWEQERAMRLEEEKRCEEHERRAAQEVERRSALLAEALGWQNAVLIRNYVDQLDSRVGEARLSTKDLLAHAKWREWALVVADEMDQSESRIRGAINFHDYEQKPLGSS